MTTSETIGAIAPALIKAQSQMQGIIKEGKNPAFRSKYVTLDSILDTLRPILTSNGLEELRRYQPARRSRKQFNRLKLPV